MPASVTRSTPPSAASPSVPELPPPTQGVAALEALGLLEGLSPRLVNQIACARLALEDALAHVWDGADVGFLLEQEYLDRRRGDIALPVAAVDRGTVYLCVVD